MEVQCRRFRPDEVRSPREEPTLSIASSGIWSRHWLSWPKMKLCCQVAGQPSSHGRVYVMSTMGLFHMALGLVALGSGTLLVCTKKGTRLHRIVGRGYALSMLLLNGTALLIYNLFDRFGPFHAAALASFATVVAGVLSARRRRPGWSRRHAYLMSWSYCGLLAATAAEIASRVPGWDFFWSVFLSSLIVILAGAIVISRRVPGVVSRVPKPKPSKDERIFRG